MEAQRPLPAIRRTITGQLFVDRQCAAVEFLGVGRPAALHENLSEGPALNGQFRKALNRWIRARQLFQGDNGLAKRFLRFRASPSGELRLESARGAGRLWGFSRSGGRLV